MRDANGEIWVKGRLSWQQSEDICEIVCDQLCKKPDEAGSVEELEEICRNCPLSMKLEEFVA